MIFPSIKIYYIFMGKILDDEQGIILRNGQVSMEYRDDLKIYGAVYYKWLGRGWIQCSIRKVGTLFTVQRLTGLEALPKW